MRVAIAAITLLLVSATAHGGDVEKAKAHFKTGLAAFTLGDYAKAALEYEAAYSEMIDPALLYNAAQAHRLAGNKPRALFLYQNYLRYFPTQSNRAEVQRHVENLQAAIEAEQKAKTTPPTESKQPSETRPSIEARPTTPTTTAPSPTTTAPAPTTTEAKPSVAAAALTTESPPPPRKKTPKWLWGVVGGAVAVVAVGLGVGLGVGLSGTSYPNADIGAGKLH
jgi:tetratricopeptide (TPR) repeat protein